MAEEQSESTEQTEETTPSPIIEERARMSGWTSKEEFKGDASRWVDAETWNKRSDELMPILKATNQRLEKSLGATQAEVTALKKTLNQLVKTNETVSEREYNRALETIRKEQRTAIETQDGEKWENLERKKEELLSSKPSKIEVQEESPDEVANKNRTVFEQRNASWYEKDPEMTGFAVWVGSQLAKQGVPEALQFPEIERQVMAKFPQKFENKRRNESSVDGGSGLPAPPGNKKQSYDALPKDIKDACDSHVKSITSKYPNRDAKQTRAEWVKIYYESEA